MDTKDYFKAEDDFSILKHEVFIILYWVEIDTEQGVLE